MLTHLALSLALALPPMPPVNMGSSNIGLAGGQLCYPNGLRVSVLTDTRQPVVSLIAVVDGGSRLDPAGKAGTAHLMEHLWFRTLTPGGAQVHQALMAHGGRYNAFTAEDVITFQVTASKDSLPALLALEAQRQRGEVPSDAAVLAEERRIVLSERTLRNELDWDAIVDIIGFGGSTSETAESIAAVDVAALTEVAKRWRAPSATTLVLRGAIDATEADKALRAAFGESNLMRAPATGPAACDVAPAPPAPPTLAPKPADLPVRREALDEAALLFGWRLPGAYAQAGVEAQERLAETLASRRLNAVFGDTETHREQFQPGCGLRLGNGASYLVCSLRAPPGRNANRLLERATKAIATEGDGELLWIDQTIAGTRVEQLLALTDLNVTADGPIEDALRNHFRRNPLASRDLLGSWGALTEGNVLQATRAWLSAGSVRAVLALPPGEDPARYLGGDEPFDVSGTGTSRVTEPASSAFTARSHTRPPPASYSPAGAPLAPNPIRWKESTLGNGLRVIAVQHGKGQVHAGLRFHAGPPREERPGLDAWVWERTVFDLTTLVDGSIARSAGLFGGRFDLLDLGNRRAFEVSGLAEGLDGQLWVLAAVAEGGQLEPWTDDTEYLRRAFDGVPSALNNNPDVVAEEARNAHLFGADSPLARHPLRHLIAAQLTPEAIIKRHFQTWWHPKNATLVIVGDVTPDAAIERAMRMFSGWNPKAGAAAPTGFAVSTPPAAPLRRWVDRQSATTSLTVACRVPSDLDRATANVAMQWLDEQAWKILRESEVAAYTPTVDLDDHGGNLTLRLSVETRPGVARAAADRWLAALASQPAASDTRRAADRVARQQLLDVIDTTPVFHRVMSADAWGVTPMSPESLDAVRPESIAGWLAGCATGAAITAVGPEDPFQAR